VTRKTSAGESRSPGPQPSAEPRPAGPRGIANPGKIALIATASLIVFALAVVFWPSISGQAGPSSGTTSSTAAAERGEVIYFHRTERCASCLWAADATEQTLDMYFHDELRSGKVTYRAVNVQDPANAALVERYRATGSSLYINFVRDGQDNIVQASSTYPYIGNFARFSERLRSRIVSGLGVQS
jgi:hypothetical protein